MLNDIVYVLKYIHEQHKATAETHVIYFETSAIRFDLLTNVNQLTLIFIF